MAADQREVAVGYEQLEALALRIADAVEEDDAGRAEQIRTAIGSARTLELSRRFDRAVALLERERFAAAGRDQVELAKQLEELLRLVMADPSESRFEEEKRRLEALRKEVRAALREQRGLRSRSERGELAETAARQEELANRIERLQEIVPEEERATESSPPADGEPGAPANADSTPSLGQRLQSAGESMRGAGKKLADNDPSAAEDQKAAQRELEAAQREVEERLRQLREEEQQRKLASLADRFRRMREEQAAILKETNERVATRDDGSPESRATRLAAAKLAEREASVGLSAQQALRVVRADGTSRVFDEALVQVLADIRSAEERLRESRLDALTIATEQSVVDALSEMLAAVDQALDDLERRRAEGQGGGGGPAGDQALVSKLAELRMIRAVQARIHRQTKAWRSAAESAEDTGEALQRLGELAIQQRKLAEAAEAAASP